MGIASQRFDAFTLDLETGELRKGDSLVKLHPQPTQLLVLLVKRVGTTVGREEIQKELWPDDTFVDFDTGINSCVRQIRTALGDDAEKPRFIETVPKKGYRFVAPLHSLNDVEKVESPKRLRRFGPAIAWASIIIGLVFSSYIISGYINPPPPKVVSVERLTEHPGRETYPSLSPDGEWLVYASATAGNLDIYLQSVGGENAINLTADCPYVDTMPAFSPDGKLVAFRSEREGTGIFVMGRTGESVRKLTPPIPTSMMGEYGFNPSWSPDGKAIVFATSSDFTASSRGGNYSELLVVDVETGEMRKIKEADAVQPQWSPHGHRIAYWTAAGGTERREVWTIPADGGQAIQVTEGEQEDWNPAWSPDGGNIYFLSRRSGSDNVWRVPIDERSGKVLGEPEPVTSGEAPSRNYLSLSNGTGDAVYSVETIHRNIERYELDPLAEAVVGGPVPITAGSALRTKPSPSPDGEWLCYEQEGHVYVSRIDGTQPVQLTEGFSPSWSPDSTRIAHCSHRGGSRDIWVINRDGTGLQQLTDSPEERLSSPVVWSPDGARIVGVNMTPSNRGVFIFNVDIPWSEQVRTVIPNLNEHGDYLLVRSWSPDGRRLIGTWPPNTTGKMGIGIYNLDNETYEMVFDFVSGQPRWLSDSRRFLFLSDKDWIKNGLLVTGGPLSSLYIGDRVTKVYHEIIDLAPDVIWRGYGVAGDDRNIFIPRERRESYIWRLELK